MEYTLEELSDLSGKKACVYSLLEKNENKTVFEKFATDNEPLFKGEIKDIVNRLKVIGDKTGAKEHFFKLYEGNLSDGVCALYDLPSKNLRLYCIRYGSSILIVGGGGYKPKSIRTLQDDPKLKQENYFLREVSQIFTEKVKNKEIIILEDDIGEYLDGDLKITLKDN